MLLHIIIFRLSNPCLLQLYVLGFNNGLIIQFGKNNLNNGTYLDVTLPTSFSNRDYHVVAIDEIVSTITSLTNVYNIVYNYTPSTLSKIRIVTQRNGLSIFNWICIGY